MSDISRIQEVQRQIAIQRKRKSGSTNTPKQEASTDTLQTGAAKKIKEKVDQLVGMPENRPEMVEWGKKLAQTKSFPSSENLDKLASELVNPADLTEEDQKEIEAIEARRAKS